MQRIREGKIQVTVRVIAPFHVVVIANLMELVRGLTERFFCLANFLTYREAVAFSRLNASHYQFLWFDEIAVNDGSGRMQKIASYYTRDATSIGPSFVCLPFNRPVPISNPGVVAGDRPLALSAEFRYVFLC